MTLFFKILSLVFALLFIMAAVLQYNDPDPLMWYAIYGIPAIASLAFYFGRLSASAAFLLSIGYLVGMVFAWPAKFEGFTIGKGDIVNIEEGREAFGLLFVAVVLMIYALRLRFNQKSKV